ncbi:hypothetical protein KC340_g25 [Hortaea werneckii]|nr:hypothetical protein KC340_g25 [Hortaea werneckii]
MAIADKSSSKWQGEQEIVNVVERDSTNVQQKDGKVLYLPSSMTPPLNRWRSYSQTVDLALLRGPPSFGTEPFRTAFDWYAKRYEPRFCMGSVNAVGLTSRSARVRASSQATWRLEYEVIRRPLVARMIVAKIELRLSYHISLTGSGLTRQAESELECEVALLWT